METKLRAGNKEKETFYVHEMLSTFRADPIPQAFKERHTSTVTKKLFKPKPVFSAWKEDTYESLRIAMELDLKNISMLEIVSDDKQDATRLVAYLGENYGAIKDIYHFLQGRST